VTSVLVARNVRFARGWNNPTHEQLSDLITHNLALEEELAENEDLTVLLVRAQE
jgi:hypothetical protein